MSSILPLIIKQLNDDLNTAIAASELAHQAATDKENIPENKYDTLALEAAYLAHGQSLRIDELHQSLQRYKTLKLTGYTEQRGIQISAFISLLDQDDNHRQLFLGPSAGGLSVELDGQTITVITPETPLGKQLLNKFIDDEITLTIQASAGVGSQAMHYWIEDVK